MTSTQLIGNKIFFNPYDWKEMSELCKRHSEFNSAYPGENEDGEPILISINKDNITISTSQSNGWTRENIYYPSEYTSEELYHR